MRLNGQEDRSVVRLREVVDVAAGSVPPRWHLAARTIAASERPRRLTDDAKTHEQAAESIACPRRSAYVGLPHERAVRRQCANDGETPHGIRVDREEIRAVRVHAPPVRRR